MSRNLEVVHVDHTLSEAALRMKSAGVGALLVVDADETVGIITDRDIAVRCIARGRDPDEDVIDRAMSTPVAVCHGGTSLNDAARIMCHERVRRLAVADDENQCIGVVSLRDLVSAGLDRAMALRVLRAVSNSAPAKAEEHEDMVGHGRAIGGRIGAPPSYAAAPRMKPDRTAGTG